MPWHSTRTRNYTNLLEPNEKINNTQIIQRKNCNTIIQRKSHSCFTLKNNGIIRGTLKFLMIIVYMEERDENKVVLENLIVME